jgi:outer membrane protein
MTEALQSRALLTGALLSGLLLIGTATAAPLSFTAALQAAHLHDPAFAAAQAAAEAGRTQAAMARSLWLPQLSATGMAGRGSSATESTGAGFDAPGFGSMAPVDFRTDISGGTATRWAIQAQQPLFDGARLAQYEALRNNAQAATIALRESEQQSILRTAQTWFEALAARNALTAIERQSQAAERARAEAAARYEAGDTPVTDLREAEALAAEAQLELIVARNRVELANAALADLTGLQEPELPGIAVDAAQPSKTVEPLASWQQRAAGKNTRLATQRLQRDTAASASRQYASWAAPSLGLVGQLGRESLRGDGNFGAAGATSRQALVGLQLSVPLFTGGWRSAKRQEARALERQSAAELELAEQQVSQELRSAWMQVATAAARFEAAAKARLTAAARLEATRIGVETGERTALDLLQADAAAGRTDAGQVQARLDWQLAQLRLLALAGELDETAAPEVDAALSTGVRQ